MTDESEGRKALRLLTWASAAALVIVLTVCGGILACDADMVHQRPSGVAFQAFSGNVADKQQAAAQTSSDHVYVMPLYLQTDPQWSGLAYGGATVAESGCGLTVAAMTAQRFTGQTVTPATLLEQVGDSAMVYADDGTLVNDMGAFGVHLAETCGLTVSEQYYDVDRALKDVEDGAVVWAGVSGYFGGNWYDGHVVALWKTRGSFIWVRDPYSAVNSDTAFFTSYVKDVVNWSYFYSVRGA